MEWLFGKLKLTNSYRKKCSDLEIGAEFVILLFQSEAVDNITLRLDYLKAKRRIFENCRRAWLDIWQAIGKDLEKTEIVYRSKTGNVEKVLCDENSL